MSPFHFYGFYSVKGTMTSDSELLRAYADKSSEQAFAELVSRYLDLVFSTAVRQVNGDIHLAQDITQSVFAAFARKAASLPDRVVLGGWLYRHTGFVAKQALRTERRRRSRESQAAT